LPPSWRTLYELTKVPVRVGGFLWTSRQLTG
jgi:hypothetical protein